MAADDLLSIGLPSLVLVCLVLGIRWRSSSPVWLPLAASAALLAFVAWSAVTIGPHAAGEARGVLLDAFVWCVAAIVVLLLAAVAVHRRWSSRGALVVAGLAVPAPLMAVVLSAAIAVLA